MFSLYFSHFQQLRVIVHVYSFQETLEPFFKIGGWGKDFIGILMNFVFIDYIKDNLVLYKVFPPHPNNYPLIFQGVLCYHSAKFYYYFY